MALGDRIKESTTTTSTGTLSLDGTVSGFQTFITGIEANVGVSSPQSYSDTPYTIIQSAADGSNIDIEIGRGTVTVGTGSAKDTLSRDSVVFSSNGNALVDFGAGTKTVVCAPQAADVGSVPHFELTKSADQTGLGATTWYKITWDGTASSAGCTVDLANNDVDITESGDYILSVHIGSDDSSAATNRLAFYTDGTIEGDYDAGFFTTGGNAESHGLVKKITLTAPVTISAYTYNTVDSSWSIEAAAQTNLHPVAKFAGFKIPGS